MTFLTKALLASCAMFSASQANATITLRFATQGQGTTMGLAPDIFQTRYLTNVFVDFVIDEASIRPFAGGYEFVSGLASGSSTSTGLSAGANGIIGRQSFNGGFSVCFPNPSAAFPTAGTYVSSTCNATVSASGFGSTNGFFSYQGVVTGLFVLAGGNFSEVPVIVNGVPEPSTWALMLAGFALTGYALRRRRAAVAIA